MLNSKIPIRLAENTKLLIFKFYGTELARLFLRREILKAIEIISIVYIYDKFSNDDQVCKHSYKPELCAMTEFNNTSCFTSISITYRCICCSRLGPSLHDNITIGGA